MALKRIQKILLALCIVYSCNAQLTFHNDPLSNSFTLKTPGLQQSFTRYFGGKPRAPSAALQQHTQQYQMQSQPQFKAQYQTQFQPQVQAQYQPQYQPQLQHQLQTQYQQQFQQYQQPNVFRFSSSPSYNQQSGFPFEADYEQPLPRSSPFSGAFPPQPSQFASTPSYRGFEYAQPQPQVAQQTSPSYADQMQQGAESYQQENQQMQQMLQQQQYNQQQLLLDLYKTTPQGAGRAVTSNPGRSQPFYTADQYINFLNKQHQDVFQGQQNVSDRGYSFSPMSSYTNGIAANTMPTAGMSYSPSTNASRVSYTNGKLSYEY